MVGVIWINKIIYKYACQNKKFQRLTHLATSEVHCYRLYYVIVRFCSLPRFMPMISQGYSSAAQRSMAYEDDPLRYNTTPREDSYIRTCMSQNCGSSSLLLTAHVSYRCSLPDIFRTASPLSLTCDPVD